MKTPTVEEIRQMSLPPAYSRSLGHRLLSARRKAAFTVRGAAECASCHLPVSHATIANWERGNGAPSRGMLVVLALVYGLPKDHFFTD